MCKVCGDDTHVSQDSRRHFLRNSALAMVGTLSMRLAVAADARSSQAPNAIPPAEALKHLMAGNARYVANTPRERDFSSGRPARAKAQFPIASIFGCSDSRIAPELAFDQGPGALFVMRVAGNIVTPDLLASLEYGVQFLSTPLVMVLGHTGCGAVDAAIKVIKNNTVLPGHLPGLIDAIKPAVVEAERVPTDHLLDAAIVTNIRRQVAQLKEAGPIVAQYYQDRKIDIVGAVYDLKTGVIKQV